MKSKLLLILLLAAFVFTPMLASAALTNGGFEAGMNDWTASGNVSIVATSLIADNSFLPDEGQLMALVSNPDNGGYFLENVLKQTFTPDAKYLNVRYNFWTFDSGNYDKFAVFLNGVESFSLSASDAGVAGINGLNFTDWTGVSFILPNDRNGDPIDIFLAFSAGNTGDPLNNSGVFLDNLTLSDNNLYAVANSVPIPSALFLLGSGLVGLVAMNKKRLNG